VSPCGSCNQSARLVAFYEAQADRALAAQLKAEIAEAEQLERIRKMEKDLMVALREIVRLNRQIDRRAS
jgi:hypothetical protein